MCGRYTQTKDLLTLEIRFGFTAPATQLNARYNVAPMQYAPVIVNADGARRLQQMRWGLAPFWAKDDSSAAKLINARAETIAEKPSFRQALSMRRCLVLADGFYEWSTHGRAKTPYYFYLREGQPFAIAGLFEQRRGDGGEELQTFTIITTAANELLAPVHHRMPVILPPEAEELWLDPHATTEELLAMLVAFPAASMAAHEVSSTVNSVKNDSSACTSPLA
jgi:putative SOS response-associated peptidase YedK